MSNFPLMRFKEFKKWIPSTDIDDVDAPSDVLTTAVGVDYKNGWIENAHKEVVDTLPSNVHSAIISQGYEILSARGFHHSEQGDTNVYVLYKYSSGHYVKIFVNNTEMDIDEQNSDVTWQAKPKNINYNLVNDQLKINLNCNVTYNSIGTGVTVLANLTLVYLDSISYDPSQPTLTRGAGWYLFPRWLGWSYNIDDMFNPPTTYGTEDFEDSTYLYGLSPVAGYLNQWKLVAGSMKSDANKATDEELWSSPFKTNVYANGSGKKVRFKARCSNATSSDQLNVKVMATGGTTSYWNNFNITDEWKEYEYEFPESITSAQVEFVVFGDNEGQGVSFDVIWIDDVEILTDIASPDTNPVVLIAKYFDGQRGLIGYGVYDISVITFNNFTDEIDWRVVEYELYYKKQEETVYYLKKVFTVDGTWGTGSVTGTDIDEVKSLVFNYGLPYDTRVDNQRDIYMEILHKGRIFFVKDDYKVYQSHITANLAIQADSFPYDEDVGFGYFITSRNRKNRGLAVTPTNNLAIFTDSGYYIYYIQPSSVGSYKTLRLSSGSIGLSSRDTIAKSLTGDPATDGLFWADNSGVYLQLGDSQPPRNLLLPTHEQFWRDISKTNLVGFYNPLKREYWLVVEDSEDRYVMAYEVPYGDWKGRYDFAYEIDELFGVFNNVLYYRSGPSTIVKYDMNTKGDMYIETPYNTGRLPVTGNIVQNTVLPEIFDKILQMIYIVFATGNDKVNVKIAVYYDDKYLETYTVDSTERFVKFLAPLGVRFNRVKLIVYTTDASGKDVRIKEFGCAYSVDFKEPLAQQVVDDSILAASYGYGRSYGRAYGRT